MTEHESMHFFAYGALRRPEVQVATFGRVLAGAEDRLPGYRRATGDADAIAVASADPADAVDGVVLQIGEEDIWTADAREAAEHARTSLRLASGIDAWVYVAATPLDDDARLAALVAAERRAFALFDAIERAGIIAAARTELAIERDIHAIAARDFGVAAHWHDRVVRAGANTLCIAGEAAPDRVVELDDIVFLDLGPVFGDWEADVGRSYVVGDDPDKRRLVADLEVVFDALRARFDRDPDITGADLYAAALDEAAARGWRFGGRIAGHLVGKYPYARSPAGKDGGRVSPANTQRMRDRDMHGQARHWILEVHLVAPDDRFGGFYERLLLPDGDARGDQ